MRSKGQEGHQHPPPYNQRLDTLPADIVKDVFNICRALDLETLDSSDFYNLGSLVLGLSYVQVRALAKTESPTQAIIQQWCTRGTCSFHTLLVAMEKLERQDVVCELRRCIVPKLDFLAAVNSTRVPVEHGVSEEGFGSPQTELKRYMSYESVSCQKGYYETGKHSLCMSHHFIRFDSSFRYLFNVDVPKGGAHERRIPYPGAYPRVTHLKSGSGDQQSMRLANSYIFNYHPHYLTRCTMT